MLSGIIARSVDSGIFGFLCVLDGVRVIEDDETKGDFQLNYIKGSKSLLNAADSPMLHDLYSDPDV